MAVISPPAIDVHAHYLPPSYRAALERAGIEHPDGMPAVPAWTESSAIALMDEVGIGAALISISSPGLHFAPLRERAELARAVNEEGADACRAHPARLGLLASLPLPDVDASLHEIEQASEVLSADGFSMLTNYDGVYVGDPRFEPVMEELNRRGALVALHPTSPPGVQALACGRPAPMIEFPFDTTRAVANLILSGTLLRHPRIRVLVPHVGSALTVLADRLQGFIRAFDGPDAADVFGALGGLWFDVTGDAFPNALAALLRIAPPDRVLYGSDLPFGPPAHVMRAAEQLLSTDLLDARARRALLRDNALCLVPRLDAVAG
jgi:predicted TIM-barrel fold metal-dependent hydrolase